MTKNRTYSETEGEFHEWQQNANLKCRSIDCGAPVQFRVWESDDGAYDDVQFQCAEGHTWWVDGIDS